MKKVIVVCMFFAFILTACNATSIGVIGGADAPTAILVSNENDMVTSGDEWGLTLYADDVTNSGMTVKFMQFGGNPSGELKTGEWFELEKIAFDNWQAVDTNPLIDYVWNSVAYMIKSNDITELKVEWKWLYGELPAGSYRLSKKVMDYRAPGDFDEKVYKVYFTIE